MLFDELMTQSEINSLLDEIFGDPEGVYLDGAEGAGLTLYEESRRTPTIPGCSLLKAAFSPPYGRSMTEVVLVNPGAGFVSKRLACA